MRSWIRPVVPPVPGHGDLPRVFNTATGQIVETQPIALAGLYVCGITPYDATHIGHAATYLAYDTLIRLWLDAGYDVSYLQNITDIDDPLLERALAIGADWRELAASETELFRRDMSALGVIPPDYFVAVTEVIDDIAVAVDRLLSIGIAYRLENDIYFDIAAASAASEWHLGQESGYDRETMLTLSAERGGDPDRPGKRDPLDPLLWRGRRPGEPYWLSQVGEGRPGWHIECSVIAIELLDLPMTVNGGGIDLAFPHHEFTAAHTASLTGHSHAHAWVHSALVGYEGEKMSKSLGNLVLVSSLRAEHEDPRAIRLAILAHHYRSGWEWTAQAMTDARDRLARWSAWAERRGTSDALVSELRSILVHDLDTPAALAAVDARAEAEDSPPSVIELAIIHSLLGVDLRPRELGD